MIATLDALDITSPQENTIESEAPAPRRRGGGPKTEEGKNASRRNSLKHSLRSTLILPDELQSAYVELKTAYFAELKPVGRVEEQLVGRLAFTSVQLDRSADLAIANLRRVIERAENFWDVDQRAQADDLGKRLKNDPERIAHRLERSTQGADWLIDRWEGLADALESRGQWDDAQRNLAFDLLGTSPILRDGHARVPAAVDRDGLMNLVKDEVGRLADEQRTTLSPLDTHEQDLACCGMPVEPDAETKRLRKYESDLSREWRWAYEQLFKLRSDPSRLTRVEAHLSKFPLPAMENPAPESVAESQTNVVAPLNVAVVEDDEGMIWSNPGALANALAELETLSEEEDEEEVPASAPVPTPVPVSTPIVAHPAAPRFVPSGAKGGNRQQRRAAQKRAHQEARRSSL